MLRKLKTDIELHIFNARCKTIMKENASDENYEKLHWLHSTLGTILKIVYKLIRQ